MSDQTPPMPIIGHWPLSTGAMSTDPAVATFNDTSNVWRCWRCGTIVPPGGSHVCQIVPILNQLSQSPGGAE